MEKQEMAVCPRCNGSKIMPEYESISCERCNGIGEVPKYDVEREKAFDMVKDKNNWKNPILAIIKADMRMREIIKDAIAFYAGSPCLIVENRNGYCMVQAPGYYVCVGA